MSHTPTPWLAGKHGELRSPDGRQVEVYGLQIAQVMSSPTEEDRANAAFIVKAVNAHDDLVAALNSIAHTFIENSAGGLSTLPAGEYQRMAREALTRAGLL